MKFPSFLKNKKLTSRALTFLGLAAIFYILHRVGWHQVRLRFSQVGWMGAALLMFFGLLEAAFDARALERAIFDQVSFWRILYLNQAGALLNIFAPGEAGEILKASLLEKEARHRGASGTVVWNVVYKLSKSLVILAAALTGWLFLPALRGRASFILAASLTGFILYFGLMMLMEKGLFEKLTSLLKYIPGLKPERVDVWSNHASQIEKQATSFHKHHPARFFSILTCQIAARLAGLASLWVVFSLLQKDVTFFQSTLLYSGLELIGYLLPLLPTRLGTTEGSSYVFFTWLGWDGGLGAILQIILRLRQITTMGLCLFISFLMTPKQIQGSTSEDFRRLGEQKRQG